MRKPKASVAASTEEQPSRGGSFLRDPETGALTQVEGPATQAELDEAAAADAGDPEDAPVDDADPAAPSGADQNEQEA